MATNKPYVYEQLPSQTSFRVMSLLPGNGLEPLRCEIEITTLEAGPIYEALSYVWGDNMWDGGIFVETSTGEHWLKTTFSLASYLHRRRSREATRTLWVDSVCINQEDADERAQQVKLMDKIYRAASAVDVWLGEDPDDEFARMALECMEKMSEAWTKLKDLPDLKLADMMEGELMKGGRGYFSSLGIEMRDDSDIHRDLDLPLPDSLEWQAFIKLCGNPWFERAWTWQESYFANKKRLYLNGWSFSHVWLRRAALALWDLQKVCTYNHSRILERMMPMISDAFNEPGSYKTLAKVLYLRRGARSKEPHDFVYSLLGAKECPAVRVDYRVPYEQVYTELTWQLILQQGNLSIFDELGGGPPNLPSWVPDWRETHRSGGFATSELYRATGSSRCSVQLTDRILSACGVLHDQIKAIHPADEVGIGAWVGSHFTEDFYTPTQESLTRALRRVTFLDTTAFDPGPPDDTVRWQPNSHDAYELIELNESRDYNGRVAHARLFAAYIRLVTSRSIFVTDNGFLGMASNIVKPGDQIVFLFGGAKPFLLCPIHGHYIYISNCYVHGFMDGEALIQKWKAEDPDSQDVSWLDKLHLQDPPFPVDTFDIH